MCAFDTQRRALTYGVCCVHAYVDRSQLGSLKIANEISNNPTLHVRSFDTHAVRMSHGADFCRSGQFRRHKYVQTVNELPRVHDS